MIDPNQSIINQHQDNPPPPLLIEVPSEIDHLYVQLLAKEPHQRPSTAQDILDLLDPTSSINHQIQDKDVPNPSTETEHPLEESLEEPEFSMIETALSPYSITPDPKQPKVAVHQEDAYSDFQANSKRYPPQSYKPLSFFPILLLSMLSVLFGIGLAYFI
jgi:serine/threonine protein kinase